MDNSNLIPTKFDNTTLAMHNPDVRNLVDRFASYCWRLGFEPLETKIDTTALYVKANRNNIGSDIKRNFTESDSDEQGQLWLRLAYVDVHNELITERSLLTKPWFEGYKIPQFNNGR